MGDIKDAYDLMEKLISSVKDRKTLELLAPIKDKIDKASSENLALQSNNLDLRREHEKEMTNLKLSHSQTVTDLKDAHTKESSDFKGCISVLEAQLEKIKAPIKSFTPRDRGWK